MYFQAFSLLSESLKTVRLPPPTNDVPGEPSGPGSSATAYSSWLTPASSTSPVCQGPEMKEA